MSSETQGSTLDTGLWIVVPAAGRGQRLGGKQPKQYQQLDGITLLERSLAAMLAVPGVQGVVVALSKDDNHWHTLELDDARVHTVVGGDTRAASVLAGIDYVQQKAAAGVWVMVHDAARPLVAGSDIQRLINAVYNSGAIGGLLATPVQDTLKKADEYAGSTQTIERVDLWQAQTPQLFRAEQLQLALSSAMQSHPEAITDEASAMELAGHQPLLVEALEPNLKITRALDWELASALLQSRRLSAQTPAS